MWDFQCKEISWMTSKVELKVKRIIQLNWWFFAFCFYLDKVNSLRNEGNLLTWVVSIYFIYLLTKYWMVCQQCWSRVHKRQRTLSDWSKPIKLKGNHQHQQIQQKSKARYLIIWHHFGEYILLSEKHHKNVQCYYNGKWFSPFQKFYLKLLYAITCTSLSIPGPA